ncbi:hypothetical protein O181_052768 [Austropuccinia psidii MF-1]|uniref:Uncharacterized protein n=1 Tax=Austropuccinia psidii MF-1 TaxID=1389203 RepID=A0A9Q3HPR7_9BASI|nr:hypothetical protein [Austropuccinia psidii MF-1]
MHLNVKHEGGMLELSGRNLRQCWCTYKCRFMETSQWLNHTGLGISQDSCGSLQGKTESWCPCFDKMDMIFEKKQNEAGHNVYNTYMVIEGKDQDDGVEEGDLDVSDNLYQCGSDDNDEGSVIANAEETTFIRRKAQKRCHHSDDSDHKSEHDNINEGSHIQSFISSSKKNHNQMIIFQNSYSFGAQHKTQPHGGMSISLEYVQRFQKKTEYVC